MKSFSKHIFCLYLKKVLFLALQSLVSTLEKELDESNRLSEERLQQASATEMKVIELKMAMQRFLHWLLFL